MIYKIPFIVHARIEQIFVGLTWDDGRGELPLGAQLRTTVNVA